MPFGVHPGFNRLLRLWVVGLLCAASLAHAEIPVPPLSARVTDLTGTLNASQRESLEQTLAAFEARKGSQIAVLLVATTAPEAIEQYSMRVAEAWKLGRKGVDDGVLLLIAQEDRKLRIEVGYGLEGVIPDAVAKRIVSEVIVPLFKQGDYYGGIAAGADRLIRLIEGEPLPEPQTRDSGWSSRFEALLPWAIIGLFVLGPMLRALLGRFPGALLTGGLAAMIFWFLIGTLLVASVIGLFIFLIALVADTRGGRSGSGSWSSGGGGSSSGGGGFSGGGGSFGGGGASGSW